MLWKMERVLLLFLTVMVWRESSGLAVWNQKPAYYWQGAGTVPQPVQMSGPWTQVPLSSPQPGASVSASPALQQRYDQSASDSSWFGSLGQWVLPASQGQTSNPVSQTVQGSVTWPQVSQSSPQTGSPLSAFPSQQQSYDQSVSVIPSQVLGVSPSQSQPSTAVQAQLTRPVPASGNVANLYTTAPGTYGLQSSVSPSWDAQPQQASSVSTQFQHSQSSGKVLQGSTSSGSSKWYKVMPPAISSPWNSVTPPAWVPATNNLYASLSKPAMPSADAIFQSTGLSSAFQTSGTSTSNSGSLSLSQTSRLPASVTSSRPLPTGLLPLPSPGVSTQGPLTWPSTGSSQSVLQGSASVGPVVQSNPLSSGPSRVSFSLPGATSSFNFGPGPNSQASSPYAQTPAVRVPSNQLNFNTPGTSSGAPLSPGFSSSVKG